MRELGMGLIYGAILAIMFFLGSIHGKLITQNEAIDHQCASINEKGVFAWRYDIVLD